MSQARTSFDQRSRPIIEGLTASLLVEVPELAGTAQPIAVGVPFPRGALQELDALSLLDPDGHSQPLQTRPLARWPDGSVKWLLAETVIAPGRAGLLPFTLGVEPRGEQPRSLGPLQVREEPQGFVIETGVATFRVGPEGQSFFRAEVQGRDLIEPGTARIVFNDARGRPTLARFDEVALEDQGPLRATVRLTGSTVGRARCRLTLRLNFYAGMGLVRVRLTIHNPERARHPDGLWDLGDPGSVLFRELAVELRLTGTAAPRLAWSAEPRQAIRESDGGDLEIYQDSSGGENWESLNHRNRHGRVPVTFQGYRVRHNGEEETRGRRASPTASFEGEYGYVSLAIPEFWQQFPKALEVRGRQLRIGLFPGQFSDLFELQGGERKRHDFWLHFGNSEAIPAAPLAWVHRPAFAHAMPHWYARAGLIPIPGSATPDREARLDTLLAAVVDDRVGFAVRREQIDEYGWRNYGEVYADHEAAYDRGPSPIISHYNNQYDVIYGMILQLFRTGDRRWFDLLDPLARHVMDIDIYHTDRDRDAYNGGLFWHTDHYRDAETCSHRTYSRANQGVAGRHYGGGPCNEHNYATGLLHYHFLTGDPDAREAVLGLADWVIHMDEGDRWPLGLIDDGPTGLASGTHEPEYHGPGRGAGNSINVLLDAWMISGARDYLDQAETLIRRVAHPEMDIAALELKSVERRWSYTVFLSALARYLEIKAEQDEHDAMEGYARACLLAFATWMREHEAPYLDYPEELEYPTETWAAQEFRKANVLRLAAGLAAEPLRGHLLHRGDALAERAWSDLLSFESRQTARALTILMIEGTRDLALHQRPVTTDPPPPFHGDFGQPRPFVPRKRRVLDQLKTPRGFSRALARLANPRNWRTGRRGKASHQRDRRGDQR